VQLAEQKLAAELARDPRFGFAERWRQLRQRTQIEARECHVAAHDLVALARDRQIIELHLSAEE